MLSFLLFATLGVGLFSLISYKLQYPPYSTIRGVNKTGTARGSPLIPCGCFQSDEEAIRLMADAGFDAYDFGLGKDKVESILSGDDYMTYLQNMKKLSKERNIICDQAHAPFPTGFKGVDEYNEKLFRLNIRAMECAAFVGAKIIVSHPITNLGEHLLSDEMRNKIIPFESMDECKRINMGFYKRLEPYCEKFNIKIAIENMWIKDTKTGTYHPYATGTAKDLADYIDTLDSEWFGACLDIGHSYLVVSCNI